LPSNLLVETKEEQIDSHPELGLSGYGHKAALHSGMPKAALLLPSIAHKSEAVEQEEEVARNLF